MLVVDESSGKRQYVTPTGKKLPSVTTVLGHSKKQVIMDWRSRVGAEKANKIANRAGTRGTKFHSLLESYIRNQDDLYLDIMPDMKQAFHDAVPTLDKIDDILYMEAQLFSERIGLAGRTDVIGKFAKRRSIIDFKTSLKPKKKEWIDNYFEQGTAYSLMFEDMTNIKIANIVIIISVDHEPEPQVFEVNRKDYIDSLLEKVRKYNEEVS